MNEDLAKELAAIEDELAKLKPAVEHIESASKAVAAAEDSLRTYKDNIEKLFIKVDKAFEDEIEKGGLMINELVKETRKTLSDYSDEFERNVRKQADIGRDILKEADEVVQESRDVNASTRELVDNIYGMKISGKLLASLIISTISLALVITILIR
jgi:hypothetical protein